MSQNAELFFGSNAIYSEGVFRNTETSAIIAAVSNPIYFFLVSSIIETVNKIYDQPRPITDNSIDVMSELIGLTGKMCKNVCDL